MTLRLTIVVPAFNEDHRLAAGMRRFDAAVSAGAIDLDRTEVVVVDDGSTDRTAAVAEKLLAALPHHRVVRLPVNQGKGAAVRAGIATARSPYTAFMDADMAIDPLAIPLLLDGLERNDVVVGSRALPDSMVETTYVVRTLISRLFNELVTAGTGLGLKDTQCGFKAFRTPVARLLFHLVRIDRFAFDVEVLARARRLGPRHRRGPRPLEARGGQHGPPAPRLGDHGVRRLPVTPGAAGRTSRCRPSSCGRRPGAPIPAWRDRVAGPARRAVLDGVPVSVVADGDGLVALLAMVDPADVARVHAALRAELTTAEVTRRALGLDGLAALGPLAGRLDAGGRPTPPA